MARIDPVPTARALADAFGLGLDRAVQLRDALLRSRGEGHSAVEDVLRYASRVIDGHGTESIRDSRAPMRFYWLQTVLVYVNMGDPYEKTLMYDPDTDRFFIGNWGDWLGDYEAAVGYEVG